MWQQLEYSVFSAAAVISSLALKTHRSLWENWGQSLSHISFHLCMCKDEKRRVAIQDESIRNPILQPWDRVRHCCSQSMQDASNTLNWNYLIRGQIGLSRQWLLWLLITQTRLQGHNPGAWVYTCQTGAENRQKSCKLFPLTQLFSAMMQKSLYLHPSVLSPIHLSVRLSIHPHKLALKKNQ